MKLKARIANSAASVIAAALMAQALTQEAYADSKGTIVAFIISSTNPYIGQWRKGAEAKAKPTIAATIAAMIRPVLVLLRWAVALFTSSFPSLRW